MSNVLELADYNFKKKIENHELAIVLFYAPWCGFCRKFEPEFEKAAKELKEHDPPITCVKVNCSSEGRDTCRLHKIFGYPTLKVFKKGNPEPYVGPRNEASIVAHMKKCCGDLESSPENFIG